MLVKFLRPGRSPRGAAEYLLGKKDHKGEVRPTVEVLRGDPMAVAEYAESLPFKSKYVSAAISFGHDRPTPAQLDRVMDAFESACFGDLDRSRFSYSFVNHGDHLHFLMAKADLDTGNSFSPNPPVPSTNKRFGSLRDALNYEYGWARPDDPRRARGPEASSVRKARKGPSGASSDLAGRVERVIHEKAVQGLLNSRSDVIAELGRMGLKVFRSGKTLSIENPDGGRNVRLKTPAALFSLDFDGAAYRAACARSGGVSDEPDPVKAAKCWADFKSRAKAWGDHWLGRQRKAPKAALPLAGAALAAPSPGAVAVPVEKGSLMVDEKRFGAFMRLFGLAVRGALVPPSPILVAPAPAAEERACIRPDVEARPSLPRSRPQSAPDPVPDPESVPEPVPDPESVPEPVPDPESVPEPAPTGLTLGSLLVRASRGASRADELAEVRARKESVAQAQAVQAEIDEIRARRVREAARAKAEAEIEARLVKALTDRAKVDEGRAKKGWKPPPPRPF